MIKDENELIIQALKKGISNTSKSSKNKLYSYDDELSIRDEISEKLANQRSRRKNVDKNKPIIEWSSLDFLKYANEKLILRGSRLETFSILDCNKISTLYDKFVSIIDEKMSNEILKDYIDWWVINYSSKVIDREIKVYDIAKEQYYCKFLLKFGPKICSQHMPEIKTEPATQDLNKLYELSGLKMLLLSSGVVETAFILKNKQEDWILKISNEIKKFDKKTIISVMDITISKAPYPKNKIVDFFSLTKDCLRFHGVKEYQDVSYAKFFQ